MRLGQFLFTILIALIFLAIIGFVDWGTVGSWGLFMLILALIGPLLLIVSYLIIKLKEKKSDEKTNKNLGTYFNWVLVISGFVIFTLIVSSQTDMFKSFEINNGDSSKTIDEDWLLDTENLEKSDDVSTNHELVEPETSKEEYLEIAKNLKEGLYIGSDLTPHQILVKLNNDEDFFEKVNEKYFTLWQDADTYQLSFDDPDKYEEIKKLFKKRFKEEISGYRYYY